jgi:hypothetical protein
LDQVQKALVHLRLADNDEDWRAEIITRSSLVEENPPRRTWSRAPTRVLIGESGTGKEPLARAIRNASPRRAKPSWPSMSAMAENLLEPELFGHIMVVHRRGIAITPACSGRRCRHAARRDRDMPMRLQVGRCACCRKTTARSARLTLFRSMRVIWRRIATCSS